MSCVVYLLCLLACHPSVYHPSVTAADGASCRKSQQSGRDAFCTATAALYRAAGHEDTHTACCIPSTSHTANVSIVSFGKCNDMRLKSRAYLLGWQGNRQAKLVDLIYGDVFITRKGGVHAKSRRCCIAGVGFCLRLNVHFEAKTNDTAHRQAGSVCSNNTVAAGTAEPGL